MSDKQTPKTFEEWRDLYPSNQFPIFIIGNDSLNHHIESYARQVWSARDAEINELKEDLKRYETGLKGACPTCEPVAILNEALKEENNAFKKNTKGFFNNRSM